MPDTGRGILWEASKSCIRGHLISYISNSRKVENAKTARLLKDIKAIDERYAANLLLKSRQRFYELGDKAGKLLAHQARAESTSSLIQEIKSTAGEIFNDGFTAEYYKSFSNLLSPYLTDMYNEDFALGRLPETLSEASISLLLLKKDKDPLLCGSYRPISLLNVDFKILSKILALRLQTVLSPIIDPDQTGFMPNRQSFHNTRRLLNITASSCSLSPEVVVSLDAEKAFDRMEWGFLHEVLARFGLGGAFVKWVKLLYSSPKASVRTNDISSSPFPLGHGTRQGCPLSPLLFTLVIEPLALWLRSDAGFQGITRLDTVHKVSLYADDLLLYVSDPISSFPTIFKILNEYSSVSRYKLNYQKSEILPINDLAKQLPQSIVPFKWSNNGFQYLGIHITSSLSL